MAMTMFRLNDKIPEAGVCKIKVYKQRFKMCNCALKVIYTDCFYVSLRSNDKLENVQRDLCRYPVKQFPA